MYLSECTLDISYSATVYTYVCYLRIFLLLTVSTCWSICSYGMFTLINLCTCHMLFCPKIKFTVSPEDIYMNTYHTITAVAWSRPGERLCPMATIPGLNPPPPPHTRLGTAIHYVHSPSLPMQPATQLTGYRSLSGFEDYTCIKTSNGNNISSI